jgi:hypothetical protein
MSRCDATNFSSDYFLRYEFMRLEGQPIYFKDQRAIAITVQSVSAEKAQLEMLSLGIRRINCDIIRCKQRLEKMEYLAHLKDAELNMRNLGQSYLLLNNILLL